jgi:NADPH-dependent curcumin reductase CurA
VIISTSFPTTHPKAAEHEHGFGSARQIPRSRAVAALPSTPPLAIECAAPASVGQAITNTTVTGVAGPKVMGMSGPDPGYGLEIRLASRPVGMPVRENFEVVDARVGRARPGQVLVRNLVMSIDPYMRNRMNPVQSYVSAYRVGEPLDGGAVGEVVHSEARRFSRGDLVVHELGWREYAVVDADRAGPIEDGVVPVGTHLGALGMPGLTAYAGLTEVAGVRRGETVFITAGAGAVGTIAGQIARILGAGKVIGSAGSAAKVRFLLDELGFDAAFCYRDGPLDTLLHRAAPDGVDVCFDNVGGEHLEAAIAAMNPLGRVAMCGMISQYNRTELAAAPRNIMQVIGKRLNLRGFLVDDYLHVRDEFRIAVGSWIRDGHLSCPETVVDGLRNAPAALIGLFHGDNVGKMLVRIAT